MPAVKSITAGIDFIGCLFFGRLVFVKNFEFDICAAVRALTNAVVIDAVKINANVLFTSGTMDFDSITVAVIVTAAIAIVVAVYETFYVTEILVNFFNIVGKILKIFLHVADLRCDLIKCVNDSGKELAFLAVVVNVKTFHKAS